jgi:hypothetical protein
MALTTIRRYRDLSDAIVARCLLESAGIEVELRDENLIRLDWQVSNFIGGIRLQVEDNDANDAIDILDSPMPETIDYGGENSPYTQPRCPQCRSSNITFEGSSRGSALIVLFALSLPSPVGTKTWLCHDCANRWDEVEEPGP